MEQVPFIFDGLYSKKNPQFPVFDQLESAVLLMAVWLGLVKLVGKKWYLF